MFWVPQSGDIGVGVSILSYNDNVQFSLITDRNFVPDPETITPLFAAEFEKMMLALLMLDWKEPLDLAQVEQQLFGKQMPPPLVAGKPEQSALARRRSAASEAKPKAAKTPVTKRRAKQQETSAAEPAARAPKRFRHVA
jgi:hypothetical protein